MPKTRSGLAQGRIDGEPVGLISSSATFAFVAAVFLGAVCSCGGQTTAGAGDAGGNRAGDGGAGSGGRGGTGASCQGEFAEDTYGCAHCDDPKARCVEDPWGGPEPVCTLNNQCQTDFAPARCMTNADCPEEFYCCRGERCRADGKLEGVCLTLGCGPGPECLAVDELTQTCRYVADLAPVGVSCYAFADSPVQLSGSVRQRSATHVIPGTIVEFFDGSGDPICDPVTLEEQIQAFAIVSVPCVSKIGVPSSVRMVVTPAAGEIECDVDNNSKIFEVDCDPMPCGSLPLHAQIALGEFPCPAETLPCRTELGCWCIKEADWSKCPDSADFAGVSSDQP